MFHQYQVSDVNDDVRRAAVTSIGFILFRWVILNPLPRKKSVSIALIFLNETIWIQNSYLFITKFHWKFFHHWTASLLQLNAHQIYSYFEKRKWRKSHRKGDLCWSRKVNRITEFIPISIEFAIQQFTELNETWKDPWIHWKMKAVIFIFSLHQIQYFHKRKKLVEIKSKKNFSLRNFSQFHS